MSKFLCPDCSAILEIPKDIVEDELISCPSCGLELVYRNGNLEQLEIEGEDWENKRSEFNSLKSAQRRNRTKVNAHHSVLVIKG